MAMEINGSYSQYDNHYAEKLRTKQRLKTEPGGMPLPRDEYISSEASDSRSSGLYRLGRDEHGDPKILYDDPKKAVGAGRDGSSGKAGEQCTLSTDQVDREIRQLKEERKQLEQQIKAASGNGEKLRELKEKLAQVESELNRKDNDTYRQQHAVVSNAKGKEL